MMYFGIDTKRIVLVTKVTGKVLKRFMFVENWKDSDVCQNIIIFLSARSGHTDPEVPFTVAISFEDGNRFYANVSDKGIDIGFGLSSEANVQNLT